MTATVAGDAAAVEPTVVRDNVVRQKDLVPRRLALLATIVSFAAFFWFQHKGQTLLYQDSISHMQIARRVFDSPTATYAQLGGVWLPAQHLLMMPFIWYRPLYYSGFGGSIISMGAYVATSVLLYKMVYNLTGNKLAGVVGALVFMTNPNVLYMQSTPMSELLLFVSLAGMVYGVQRWIQTDQAWPYLAFAVLAGLLGVTTRYEAWVSAFVLMGVVLFAAWRKNYPRDETIGAGLAFALGPVIGIGIWVVYCWATFHNPLYWYNGPYAKPSLWVNAHELAVGHWLTSARIYGYAMSDDLLLPGITLALIGLVVMAIRERMSLRILPALSLLALIPFFIYSLESGQRPLHVRQINGDLYNVRFGLLMIIPAAIFVGYLSSLFKLRWLRFAVLGIVLGATAYGFLQVPENHIVTETEASGFSKGNIVKQDGAGNFMRAHYTHGNGGIILEQFFGNENVLFQARINLVNNVYEGSDHLWLPALQDPLHHDVQWIIMKSASSDKVFQALHGTAKLDSYELVYNRSGYLIYERN